MQLPQALRRMPAAVLRRAARLRAYSEPDQGFQAATMAQSNKNKQGERRPAAAPRPQRARGPGSRALAASALRPQGLYRSGPGAALERDRRPRGGPPGRAGQAQRGRQWRHADPQGRARAPRCSCSTRPARYATASIAFLGRPAVSRLRFVQGPLAARSAPAPALRTPRPVCGPTDPARRPSRAVRGCGRRFSRSARAGA